MLSALERLRDSEKYACLTSNVMLYRTGFVSRCLAEYHAGLCADFICSLFSVKSRGCFWSWVVVISRK